MRRKKRVEASSKKAIRSESTEVGNHQSILGTTHRSLCRGRCRKKVVEEVCQAKKLKLSAICPFEECEDRLKSGRCTGTFTFLRKLFSEKKDELEGNKPRRRNAIMRLIL